MTILTFRSNQKQEKSKITEHEQFLTPEFKEIENLEKESSSIPFKTEIVWRNVAIFTALHLAALLGIYQMLFQAKWQTNVFVVFMHVVGAVGVTAGAHRLWSHRSFKAVLPIRILLMIMNTTALQNDIIEWARDHRCHHKWTDTHADPHNTNRGMFFAHMGWLMVKKHPQLKSQGAKLDLSDLYDDPVCTFQRKYYYYLVLIFCFLLPTAIPLKFWGESAFIAFYTAGLARYCLLLHATWFINSVAHMFGFKPYDDSISPVESTWTSLFAVGEGGHNFHHTFPQDYRTSEWSYALNFTKLFIDFWALFGLIYDRKYVAEEVIERQCSNKGNPDLRKLVH